MNTADLNTKKARFLLQGEIDGSTISKKIYMYTALFTLFCSVNFMATHLLIYYFKIPQWILNGQEQDVTDFFYTNYAVSTLFTTMAAIIYIQTSDIVYHSIFKDDKQYKYRNITRLAVLIIVTAMIVGVLLFAMPKLLPDNAIGIYFKRAGWRIIFIEIIFIVFTFIIFDNMYTLVQL